MLFHFWSSSYLKNKTLTLSWFSFPCQWWEEVSEQLCGTSLAARLNHNHSVFECWSTGLHCLQDSSKCPNKTSSKTILAYSELPSKLPDLLCNCTNWIDGDNSNREEKPGSNENNWQNGCNFSKNLGVLCYSGCMTFNLERNYLNIS